MSEASSTTEKTKPTRTRRPRVGVVKGMRVRIYPTFEQQAVLVAWMGACRWTWNWALNEQQNHYRQTEKHLSTTTLSRTLTTLMKAGIEPRSGKDITWLAALPRTSLTCTLNALKTSWTAFFDGCSGKRQDKPGAPQFQAYKKAKKSISFQVDHRHASRVDCEAGTINFPGVGKIKTVFTETIPGDLTQLTISRQGGRWFAALGLVNVPVEAAKRLKGWDEISKSSEITPDIRFRQFENPLDQTGFVAFDAAVVHGAVATSNGETTFCLATEEDRKRADKKRERKKKHQRRLARAQRQRQAEYNLKKGKPKKAPIAKGVKLPESKRQKKLADKVGKIELHLKNARTDRSQKFTTALVREFHTIIGETLLASAMAKSLNRGFRRRFHEAGIGEIFRQIEYKCAWYGRTFIRVDRWFPSSKRCSNPACHVKNTELKLSDRAWVCPHCQSSWNRDDNAAFNLWQEGQRLAKLYHDQEHQIQIQDAEAICLSSAAGSAVVARQDGFILDARGSDLPLALEAIDQQGAGSCTYGVVSSVNREAVLTRFSSGHQKPARAVGMEPTSRTAE